MEKPFVSVVIAAKNAERTLAKCLDSVFKQGYPHFEVVLVNDGSTDATPVIAARYPKIVIVNTANAGCSGAKALGVGHSKGEFVAFLDSDAFVKPDWLNQLLRGFVNDRVAGVGGVQESPADEDAFGKLVQRFFICFGFISNYMQTANTIREVDHNANCNVMYRLAALKEVGGFWTSRLAGEDVDLDHRLQKKGYLLFMNSKAVIYHYRVKDLKGFINMMFRYGMGQGYLVRLHGVFRPLHVIPFLALAGLILFALLTPQHSLLAWGSVMAGFLLIGFLARLNPKIFLLAVAAFIAWHAGFARAFLLKTGKSVSR